MSSPIYCGSGIGLICQRIGKLIETRMELRRMMLSRAYMLAITLALASHNLRRHVLACRPTEPSAQPHILGHQLGATIAHAGDS